MEINIVPLDTALKAAEKFVQAIITPTLEELGGVLADKVKGYRLKNQINIVVKAEELLRSKRVKTKKVSLKMLAPLLEECALEEDESLQEKWIALLANTVAEDSKINTNIFVGILGQMTPSDAEVFEAVFEHCTGSIELHNGPNLETGQRTITPAAFKEVYEDVGLIFDNLKRLRLIREISTHGSDQVPVVVSELGFRFMVACS
jgi:hypothetical protein